MFQNKKGESEKSSWRRNKLLTTKFSDSDSDVEKERWEKKQEKSVKEEKDK